LEEDALAVSKKIRKIRIGVPQEYFCTGLSEQVLEAWNDALFHLESQGMEIVPVSLPHTQYALPAYYTIAPAEASSNLAKYDGIRYGEFCRGSSFPKD
jgi:aspartyl-tRNA(Asn)/glutamyl-tRNA(Gln) amidotransferase subunit A